MAKLAGTLTRLGVLIKTGDPTASEFAGLAAEESAGQMVREYNAYQNRRAIEWWTNYVWQLGRMSAEGAITEAHILQGGHPDFQERLHEALQAVWNALDMSVAPYLAFLAADYEARGAPVDMFYRRFARFLQDTTGPELECLSVIVKHAERWFAREGAPEVYVRIGRDSTEATFSHSASQGASERIELGSGAYLLIRRLRDTLLLRDAASHAPVGGALDPVGLTFEREGFEGMKRFLTPPLG